MLPFYYELFDKQQNFVGCIVAIGSYDLNYAPTWLGEHVGCGKEQCFAPALDMTQEVHEFSSPEEARQFMKEWWSKQ